MITVRKADERGTTRLDWLDSRHTFSFGDYYDSNEMGFRDLRVINEDRVRPGAGFPTHSHRDMEIVTYVIEGALEHKDSLGTGSIIRPGEIQRMSAGRGITHSEFNQSRSEPVHFLQIWIMPERRGIAPSYEQKAIDLSSAREKFHVIASNEGGAGSVKVHQEATISLGIFAGGAHLIHPLAKRDNAWIQVVRGALAVGDNSLAAGDGAAISAEPSLDFRVEQAAEVLLFELA